KMMYDFDRYGTVSLAENGYVKAFQEKKPTQQGLINAGVYLVNKSKIDWASLKAPFSFEKDVLEPLATEGNLYGIAYDSYFIDIGIPEDYEKAQQELPASFPLNA